MTRPAFRDGAGGLAKLWRPYIETCIAEFGAERALFSGTAARFYQIEREGK